jgi:hypothetical protein
MIATCTFRPRVRFIRSFNFLKKRIYAYGTIEENLEEEIFLYKRKINFVESTVGQ